MKNLRIMNKLPLKYKKEIIAFAEEYEKLASPRAIDVKIKARLEIVWRGETELSCGDIVDINYNCPEVLKINKKIKEFCKRTEAFGRKNFKEKDWLWDNVLWLYEPERNQKFSGLKVSWEKNYSYE